MDAIVAEVFFDQLDTTDPCSAFPAVETIARLFAITFADGSIDLDDDTLPDLSSLDLLEAVACSLLSDESMKAATLNAYNINLVIFDGESTAAALAEFRDAIALLMAVSGSLETAIKDILAAADPAIALTGDYVSVTCIDGTCMPTTIGRRSIRDEFEVFNRASRSVDEPYSALGDLDGDDTDNITEFDNVVAQDGGAFDFVVAATSPDLDGTEPIITPDGGGGLVASSPPRPTARPWPARSAYYEDFATVSSSRARSERPSWTRTTG